MKDGGGRHACPFESGARPDDAAHYACQRATWCIIGGVFKRFDLFGAMGVCCDDICRKSVCYLFSFKAYGDASIAFDFNVFDFACADASLCLDIGTFDLCG